MNENKIPCSETQNLDKALIKKIDYEAFIRNWGKWEIDEQRSQFNRVGKKAGTLTP